MELPTKIEWIKKHGLWQQVRDNYIYKKNINIDDNKKSRSIFAETIHQVCQQNGYYRNSRCGREIIWQWIWIRGDYILNPVGQTMKMIIKITAAKSFCISLPPLSCEIQVRQLPQRRRSPGRNTLKFQHQIPGGYVILFIKIHFLFSWLWYTVWQ